MSDTQGPEALTPDEREALDRAMRGWARDLNLDTETVPEVIARIVKRVRTRRGPTDEEWEAYAAAEKDTVERRGREGITCPECGMTSHNPNDIKEGYCGNCHAFTG